MTTFNFDAYRHRKENPRYILTLCVVVPFLALLVLFVLATRGLTIVPIAIVISAILISRWFVLKIMVANFMNNSIEVTPTSFPEIHRAIKDAQSLFGYDRPIRAFVYQDGTYNAYFLPLLRTKLLMVNSEIADTTEGPNPPMRFIVGRFVGALAARHYRFMWFEILVDAFESIAVFNILLYPYERAIQLTGDRLGLAFINHDIETAVITLMRLTAGRNVAHRAGLKSFVLQGRNNDGFFSFLARALSRFPHMTTRVNSLMSFNQKGAG